MCAITLAQLARQSIELVLIAFSVPFYYLFNLSECVILIGATVGAYKWLL